MPWLLLLAGFGGLVAGASPTPTKVNPTSCWKSWTAWRANYETASQYPYIRSIETTDIFTSWPSNVPTSTFCDGIPRIMQRQYSGYVTSWYTTTPHTDYWLVTQNIPMPTCTINEADCPPFITAYESAMSEYTAGGYTSSPPGPECTTVTQCPTESGACTIGGIEDATLYYWPVTVMPTTLCAPGYKTLPGKPTISGQPNTFVTKGMTFTSPYAYLSVAGLGGYTTAGRLNRPCGLSNPGTVISLHPSQITTVSRVTGGHQLLYTSPRFFSISSLNWPVRTTVSCTTQLYCDINSYSSETCTPSKRCTTPTLDPFNYAPALLAPTKSLKDAAVSFYPSFSACDVNGVVRPTWVPIVTLPGDPRFPPGWDTAPPGPSFTLPPELTRTPTPPTKPSTTMARVTAT